MIVAVSGSQGAGKTTLINSFVSSTSLPVKVMERKTARSVLSDWDLTLPEVYADDNLMMKFQDALLQRKQSDELECIESDSASIWLVERSYADLFAYTVAYAGKHNHMSDWLNTYYNKCMQAQAVYDKVIYVNGGLFPIQDDGLRPSDLHYGKMIDLFLKHNTIEMTNRYNTTLIDITQPDIVDRVATVTQSFENKE